MSTFYSISHSGMHIFTKPIESPSGGLTIDLASAPIDPGEHRLSLKTWIGGVEIYLPSYVKFIVEGGPDIGGYDVHEGHGRINRLGRWFRRVFGAPSPIPDRAVAPADASKPVVLRIEIDTSIGGLDVYRI